MLKKLPLLEGPNFRSLLGETCLTQFSSIIKDLANSTQACIGLFTLIILVNEKVCIESSIRPKAMKQRHVFSIISDQSWAALATSKSSSFVHVLAPTLGRVKL